MVIPWEGAIDDLRAIRANDVGDHACDRRLVQRDRTVGKAQEAMINPEKAGVVLRFALSADIGGWRVQRNEQHEPFASKTLVESEVAPQ